MKVRDEPVTPCTIEMLPAKQVRELRQEQGRAQIVHQPFVEEGLGLCGAGQAGQDRGVGRDVALAAAGRDDHVGARENFGVAFEPAESSARPAA